METGVFQIGINVPTFYDSTKLHALHRLVQDHLIVESPRRACCASTGTGEAPVASNRTRVLLES